MRSPSWFKFNKRKWLVLGVFSILFWWFAYAPLWFLMGFTREQWFFIITAGSVYDLVAEPIGSFIIIKFDEVMKKRKVY